MEHERNEQHQNGGAPSREALTTLDLNDRDAFAIVPWLFRCRDSAMRCTLLFFVRLAPTRRPLGWKPAQTELCLWKVGFASTILYTPRQTCFTGLQGRTPSQSPPGTVIHYTGAR
jgi:hypothetical protein